MKILKILLIFLILSFYLVPKTYAQAPSVKTEYERGKVASVSSNTNEQKINASISTGSDKGKIIQIDYDSQGISGLKLSSGDSLVVSKSIDQSGKVAYGINDRYRLPYVGIFIAFFLGLIILIAGKKGIGSVAGLIISLGIIFIYIVPSILAGQNPLTVCIIGAIAIILPTTYIAHGVSYQTTVALVSTLSALILTWIIATFVLHFTFLSGFGSEEAYDLHLGLHSLVDFRGLLLGGIIIATIGALNDVTITQAAAIFEIYKSNTKHDFDELLKKGLSIGREHVVSLVNTLVLAFVGSSLALFLLYFFNPTHQPLWVILNSEIISEEIIRTIVGTTGLLLSMPIVTVLATFICIHYIEEKHKPS